MIILENKSAKCSYIAPTVERIKLDNEISLELTSDPAFGPGEGPVGLNAPEYFNNDPFKTNIG